MRHLADIIYLLRRFHSENCCKHWNHQAEKNLTSRKCRDDLQKEISRNRENGAAHIFNERCRNDSAHLSLFFSPYTDYLHKLKMVLQMNCIPPLGIWGPCRMLWRMQKNNPRLRETLPNNGAETRPKNGLFCGANLRERKATSVLKGRNEKSVG